MQAVWSVVPRRMLGPVALLTALFATPAAAPAAELAATPSTLTSVFAGAQADDTVLLAAGSYGTFHAALKSGPVTVRPAPGATATMAVDFNPAANVRLDGLTITELDIADGRSHDITVANSRFTGQAILRTGDLVDANVVLDHNTHAGWNACSGCSEARVWLPERTSRPSGVTIKNSRFGPGGVSDGIQNGGNGVRILDNEFVGLEAGSVDGVHTDAIQLYGSKGTVIRGNWIHDVPTGIMAPDGADHEIIEHNVIDPGEYPFAITLYSDNGSIVSHNTLPDGVCAFNLRCGILNVGSKSGDPAGRGTIVRDNVLGQISVGGGSATMAVENSNLLRVGGTGAADVRGLPTYSGGTHPASVAGFALAATSLGRANASDGADRGAAAAGSTPAPSPSPSPSPSPTPTPKPTPTPAPTPTLTPGATSTPSILVPVGGGSPLDWGTAAPVVPSGPVAAYAFDERRGRIATDASGHGNDGHVRGARRTRTARSGRALDFDGRNDAVLVSHSESLTLATGMTLEAWLRPAGGRGRWHTVVQKGAAYALYASDPVGRPGARAGTAKAAAVRAGTALKLRTWTHVAATYDGHTLRVYVNGAPVAARARTGLLPSGHGALRIGGDGWTGHSFRGQIDDVRIYDRPLDAAAIGRDMRLPV